MTASWKETTLPMIFSKYKLDEIYNSDEFRLFYFFLCNLTSHSIFDLRPAYRENSKIRLTRMAAANAMGDIQQMLS